MSTPKKILITGSAGFIGFHLVKKLVEGPYEIIGLDNINDYYSQDLKYGRLAETGIEKDNISSQTLTKSVKYDNYSFIQISLEDKKSVLRLFETAHFDYVVNLAAQAGVRYSLENPEVYLQSNIIGFGNILEACRQFPVSHLVFASSSSVYGLNKQVPFSVKDNTDHPVSIYGATKKSNELQAHAYSYLFNIPVTGFRFFTVYGPWGRPDMAYYMFTKAILEGEKIFVYNQGNMQRDFTYVDDIIEAVVKVLFSEPQGKGIDEVTANPSISVAPYKIMNIGNSDPVHLNEFIGYIEELLGRKAIKEFLPLQPGDLLITYADVNELITEFSFKPKTSYKEGLSRFIEWYRSYYKI